jgi:MraZ protein
VGRSGAENFQRKFSAESEKSKRHKNMFIGQYLHTLDEKNRMSLPAKFRGELGKKVILTHGLDKSIFMFTVKEWEKFSSQLSAQTLRADNRGFNRFIFGGAVEVDIDGSGRILIPDFLKDRAGLKKNVAVIGVQNRVELWNEKIWNEYKAVVETQADQLAEKLGGIGVL